MLTDPYPHPPTITALEESCQCEGERPSKQENGIPCKFKNGIQESVLKTDNTLKEKRIRGEEKRVGSYKRI